MLFKFFLTNEKFLIYKLIKNLKISFLTHIKFKVSSRDEYLFKQYHAIVDVNSDFPAENPYLYVKFSILVGMQCAICGFA